MSWELAAQIATTLGTGVAAGTLVVGFRLYKLGRRDDYVATLRSSLSACRAGAAKLDELLGTEMVHEQAEAVVTNPSTRHLLGNIHANVFAREDASEKDLEEYLERTQPSITAPVRGPVTAEFESLISSMQTDVAPYQLDFPGLFRVIDSARNLFRNIYRNSVNMVRAREVWAEALKVMFRQRDALPSVPDLEQAMIRHLIGLNAYKIAQHDQKDIDDFLFMIEMVTTVYLEMPEAELMRQSAKARGEKLKRLSETPTISEDLREAEKCLRHALPQEQLLEFRGRVSRFEERNSPDA